MSKLRQMGAVLLAVGALASIAQALRANHPTTVNSIATTTTARPLGTFILGAATVNGCPTGFTCNSFTVAAPGVLQNANGMIADMKPAGPIRAIVMFFSGAKGTEWWSGTSVLVPAFFQSLLNAGFELVQVAWSKGWPVSPVGVQSGEEALACRPATVIKWVHDNIYAPLGLHPNIGRCGFCVTGNSSGGDQITYALSSYEIDNLVNAAIPTSGPPMASIEKGCLQEAGYAYPLGAERLIDLSYGFQYPQTVQGPCELHNATFTPTWVRNSVETGGIKYNYPATRIHMILGGMDDPIILHHAHTYFQVLVQAQQSMLTQETVPTMAHAIRDSADGLSALFNSLTTKASRTPTPTPTP